MMKQRNLVLILARELADKLASAVFLVDEDGTLVYINERAEEILGQPFSEIGALPAEAWTRAFLPHDAEGRQLQPDELPLIQAVQGRRPAHRSFRIQTVEGTAREITVTAVPLFAREEEFVGAAAIFWEPAVGDRVDGNL